MDHPSLPFPATNGPIFLGASQLLLDLTYASDYLSVVADYTIPLPAPVITSIRVSEKDIVFNATNSIDEGIFTILTSTNLTLPLSAWTAVATNIAGNFGNLTLTATNVLIPPAPCQFYILQEE